MKAFWKAKLIALINEASDLESLKAGLLDTLTGEKGPREASSQGSAAQAAPTTGPTRKDFVKNPLPSKANAGAQLKAGKVHPVSLAKLGKGAVGGKTSTKASTLPVLAKGNQKTGASPASMMAKIPQAVETSPFLQHGLFSAGAKRDGHG